MCGVIGLIYERHRDDLGVVAGVLLRTLEYRGYDSTGAAIQGRELDVELRKDVGAPSVMVKKLGIDQLGGSILCAQVRWATFGAVDRANAQPHVVRCKTYIYGAHNGNVTNCDELKAWLTSEGHQVASDNDGEMVVHTTEHFFEIELAKLSAADRQDSAKRREAMRAAIYEANARLKGSFAAVIADPVSRTLWTIKKGSSLYFGVGESEQGGNFGIASSDLSSVLKLTQNVVPLSEGEMVEFLPGSFQVYRLADRSPLERRAVRSKLRAEDTELKAPFKTFMAQEIAAQVETSRDVVKLFSRTDTHPANEEEAEDREAHARALDIFTEKLSTAASRGNRVFVLCCGSSFHAAKTSALFFNELAGIEVLPLLPGELRGQYGQSLKSGDVLIAVSQSGETKDLIDAIKLAEGRDVFRIALVNNVNSTLAQEKAELVIPLRCGPEIAVAATKSFINQLTLLYCLAAEVGARRAVHASEAEKIRATMNAVPELIARTLETTRESIRETAKLLFLAPSIHILGTRFVGIAKEGALKIREVVLNHTEGFEASEFKHGPNTILGFNTVYGLEHVARLLERAGQVAAELARSGRSSEQLGSELAGAVLRGEHIETALRGDYPLVYVTGPDQRDLDLTISQINTHKIRGSSTVIIAEENAALRNAGAKPPADNPAYKSTFVVLPSSGGNQLLTAFSATVALQSLALEMSSLKLAYLDHLGVREHGVHPDVPKNVSKSITVD